MRTVSWVQRVGVPIALVVVPAAVLALVAADPMTPTGVVQNFGIVATAPLQPAWLLVRSTGQVRRIALLVAFVIFPVLLLPAYTVKPRTATALLTALGAVLWLVSGMLMVALRSVN